MVVFASFAVYAVPAACLRAHLQMADGTQPHEGAYSQLISLTLQTLQKGTVGFEIMGHFGRTCRLCSYINLK